MVIKGTYVTLSEVMQVPFYLQKMTESGVYADFIERVPDVVVDTDRAATVERLTPSHRRVIEESSFSWDHLHRAEQVHGADIKIVREGERSQVWSGVDGLITAVPEILLGIYVADCGAVYISDPVQKVIALLHSGKKGTEDNITTKAIHMMAESFGSHPKDLIIALAPCIRPPAYDVDFARQIQRQALAAGVQPSHFIDSAVCTSSDLDRYYSYRIEKGNTGRMLALLGLRS